MWAHLSLTSSWISQEDISYQFIRQGIKLHSKMKILPLRKDCMLDNANTIWLFIENPLGLKSQIATDDSFWNKNRHCTMKKNTEALVESE